MKKLVNGIVEFRQNFLRTYRENFARPAIGQSPDTLFIACSDSRVVPNLFASTNPGDLFVIRNVGNLIPPQSFGVNETAPSESVAIEYSLTHLPISDIIVCGHSECGAMPGSSLERKIENPVLKGWLQNCNCSLANPPIRMRDFIN